MQFDALNLYSEYSNILYHKPAGVWEKNSFVMVASCLTLQEVALFKEILCDIDFDEAAVHRGTREKELFLTARILLRLGLSASGHPNVEPSVWRFSKDKSGKPRISGARHLFFNISHSKDAVAVAISFWGPAGVDIESLDALGSEALSDELVCFTLSTGERRWLDMQCPEHRTAAYIQLWTIKEALLKQAGAGLSHELPRTDALNRINCGKSSLGRSLHVETHKVSMGRDGYQVSAAAPLGPNERAFMWLRAGPILSSVNGLWHFQPLIDAERVISPGRRRAEMTVQNQPEVEGLAALRSLRLAVRNLLRSRPKVTASHGSSRTNNCCL
jgi:4'-phosphopantetheinyl transferase